MLTSDSILERTFPHPPWPVVAGHVPRRAAFGAVFVAGGLFVAFYFALQVAKDLGQLRRERALWDGTHGAPAGSVVEVPATVRVRSQSYKWVLHTNDLEVSFATPSAIQQRVLKFYTLFGALEEQGPAVVRFDVQQPEHWVLSWAILGERRRLLTLAFTASSGVLLVGGSLTFLGAALWLGADRVRRIAARGVPVACEVTEVEAQKSYGRPTGAVVYRFRLPQAFGGKAREAVFQGQDARPLLLEGGKALVACILVDQPQVFVVPRQDLFPFAFDAAVCRDIQERVRGTAL